MSAPAPTSVILVQAAAADPTGESLLRQRGWAIIDRAGDGRCVCLWDEPFRDDEALRSVIDGHRLTGRGPLVIVNSLRSDRHRPYWLLRELQLGYDLDDTVSRSDYETDLDECWGSQAWREEESC